MKIQTLLVYMMIASAAVLSACSSEEKATPFFKDTDLIETEASSLVRSPAGTINYSLPSSKCKYVVIALFNAVPGPDANNQLTKPILYGTRTNFLDFAPSYQQWTDLYEFNQALAGGDGDFDPTQKIDLAALTGIYYLLIYAYDSNLNLIASSQIMATN